MALEADQASDAVILPEPVVEATLDDLLGAGVLQAAGGAQRPPRAPRVQAGGDAISARDLRGTE